MNFKIYFFSWKKIDLDYLYKDMTQLEKDSLTRDVPIMLGRQMWVSSHGSDHKCCYVKRELPHTGHHLCCAIVGVDLTLANC